MGATPESHLEKASVLKAKYSKCFKNSTLVFLASYTFSSILLEGNMPTVKEYQHQKGATCEKRELKKEDGPQVNVLTSGFSFDYTSAILLPLV